MRRKQFLLGAIVLLASSLVVSCGIPQEEYDAALAERDATQAKVESLQTEVESLQTKVESLQDELDKVQGQIESIENDLSEVEGDLAMAQSQISSLRSDLNNANSNLAAAEAQIAKMEPIYKLFLFFDDFEDGDAVGWNLEGGWSVIQEDGNYILQGVGPCSADAGPQEWTDYTLEARIKFSQSANVNFRLTTELGMYFLNIVPEGPILNKKLLDKTLLAKSGARLQENQWIDLKVEVKGGRIKLVIDGILLFQYEAPHTVSEPLLSGTIGFESPENSVIYVDDVIVIVAK
jgi:outer membrane murein-binding lipoprotein Lpp